MLASLSDAMSPAAHALEADDAMTMCHDLRTPLTVIAAYLEMLTDGCAGTLTTAQLAMVTAMSRSAERLTVTVEGLTATMTAQAAAAR